MRLALEKTMKLKWLVVIVCLSMVGCSNSESAKKTPAITTSPVKTSPVEQFTELKEKYDSEINEFRAAIREASEEDRGKIYEENLPNAADYAHKFLKIAEENPASEVAFDSLKWIVSYDRSGEAVDGCYESLFSDHLDNEGLKDICRIMSYREPGPITEARLKKLIEESPHDSVKASATFTLASYFTQLEEIKQFIADDPERYGKSYSDEAVKYVSSFKAQPEVVESLYETVIEKYPDVTLRDDDDTTYKSLAESALFEFRHLSIGKVVPDI